MQAQGLIGVVGGNGRVGRLLLSRLAARGLPAAALVRDPARAEGLPAGVVLRGPAELAGLSALACCAPVAVAPGLVAALPEPPVRLVVLGSARRYTRLPDQVADAVRAAEAAVLARGGPSLILHPTMIYGAAGENNVQRVAALIRRVRFLPLPGGGRSLIQPIHADDVAACLEAALLREEPLSGALVI
ncbi:MAG: NADH-ubiquinone oxidoreductase, partial [Acetobacteraceae bacterium]|nr:NADH-ubiquinone oxidoreductase [Acetobacteraceae bacterium]